MITAVSAGFLDDFLDLSESRDTKAFSSWL